MKQLWIMIAGPYKSGATTTEGHQKNLDAMNRAAYEVFMKGHIPIIGVNLALPIIEVAGEKHYEELMMPISLAAAKRCDAVLRIGGPSHGADQEVETIRENGGIVFKSIQSIPNFT